MARAWAWLIVAVIVGLSVTSIGHAEDWPTAGHDNGRTGVTAEHLAPPLHLAWEFRSPSPPAAGWSPPANGYGARKNKSEAAFDDAFRVIAAGGRAYFCSSAENAVYALDAATGQVRWTWIGAAAPRLAPAFHDGRLYFGADDGKVYCLRADDGGVCWVCDAAPRQEKMLGFGRFSSVWPIRTGVLIEDGVAYFVAGLFPSEGLYFYALDAATGALRWRRAIDREVSAGLPPQGEMLAGRDSLFMTSRAAPTRWNKSDGRPRPFFTPGPDVENAHEYRFYNGGTDARLWQDRYFVYGSGALLAYDPDKVLVNKYGRAEPGGLLFNWFNGRQITFGTDVAFVATDYHVLGVDAARLPELARGECYDFERLYKRLRIAGRLDHMEEYQRLVAEHGADHPRARWIQTGPLRWGQAAWDQWPQASQEVFAKMSKKVRWMTPLEATEAMILAGRTLFAGGSDAVHAIDTRDGRVLWTEKTGSCVRGLAVSDGRLFVSTVDGSVRCFAAGAKSAEAVAVKRPDADARHATAGSLPEPCQRVVDEIAAAWRDRTGYALILGGGDGRLAAELARRTKLHVEVFDADQPLVSAARRRLLAAGLYGARVNIATGDLRLLPYPPYVFNVVVDQARLCAAPSLTPAEEALRVTRPLGGVCYVGPATSFNGKPGTRLRVSSAGVGKQRSTSIAAASSGLPLNESTVTAVRDQGPTPAGGIVRGKLPGTADWTHNYGTPANTYCNEDQQVKGPFGLLWFGEPGPRERLDRHSTPPIPLVVNGVMYTLGEDRLMAFDAYNGIRHWERLIHGVSRSGLPLSTSNMAADDAALYVVVEDRQCWRFDLATGATLRKYTAPAERADGNNGSSGKNRTDKLDEAAWAWLATDGKRLYGSRAMIAGKRRDVKHSDAVFALDIATGGTVWQRTVGRVEHDGIAVAEGRVFLVTSELTVAEKQQASKALPKDGSVPDRPAVDRRGQTIAPDLRKLVALDAATGQVLWQQPFDATDITLDDNVICDGRVAVACMVKDGIVVVHGTGSLGHPHAEFLRGEFARRALYAFTTDSGQFLWGGRKGYRKRPIIVGRPGRSQSGAAAPVRNQRGIATDWLTTDVGATIFAEPFAWDLKTGRQRQIENPLSGLPQNLDFHRGYIGCSHLLASGAALFGNKPGVSCWNIDSPAGFLPCDEVVFGCGICATPACGVFVVPEGRSGCACAVGLHTSVAFYPRSEPRTWGIGFTGGIAPVAALPVKHLAINLGAHGWREDANGRLWIPYPARGESGVIGPWLPRYKHKDEQFYCESPDWLPIAGTDRPWLYSSGCRAETEFRFRLLEAESAAATYTVRLHFAEPEKLAAGERVFNVTLQGQPVLTDFDVVKEAGGPRRAVVKEFPDIRVTSELAIGLRRGSSATTRPPILCALEAIRSGKSESRRGGMP